MRKYCFNCNKSFNASRSDQLFCCSRCRQKYNRKNEKIILPTKGKWFRMILDGIKLEEYRERKPYWEKRFKEYFSYGYWGDDDGGWRFSPQPKEIIFRNGYRKDAPEFTALVSITEKEGNPEWGAVPGEIYYTLQIHRVYNKKNC